MILHSPTANTWTLRLLLTQLYDPAMEVCELATQFLEEACESVDILQLVVAMQPTLDHLGDVGHGLLLKCVVWRFVMRALLELLLAGLCRPPLASDIYLTQATSIGRWTSGSM